MASSPSPAEDNHKNRLQDTTSKALDRIMAMTEQSYDDFVGSFTYLKKNDYLGQNVPHEPDSAFLSKRKVVIQQKIEKSKSPGQTWVSHNTHSPHQDELETEVLAHGDTSSRLSQSKMLRTGAAVKVDNFVDSEDISDGVEDTEEVHTEGYTASFSAGSGQQSQTRRDLAANQSCDSTSASEMAELLSGQISLDENSTDKLILNFIADLQNETNEQNRPSAGDTSLDIQKFVDKKKQEQDEVTFSDEDGDSTSNLLDNSEKGKVKVIVKPEELIAIESEEKSKPVGNSEDISIDSEGNRVVNESRQSTSPTYEFQGNPENTLFPGEAENTDDNPGTSHESLLDFKAIHRESSSEYVKNNIEAECSNAVEPFHLDKDFDYDNVVLTPKYSQEDVRKLRTIVTQVS